MNNRFAATFCAIFGLLFVDAAQAQLPKSAHLFEQQCISCHSYTEGQPTPDVTTLRQKSPEAIVEALAKGAPHEKARQLSDEDKRLIAEYLSGRNFMAPGSGEASQMPNRCPSNPPITSLSTAPAWNGWGVDATNGRYQSEKAAALPANQASRLKVKWAFGFPGASSLYASRRWSPDACSLA